MSSQDIDKAYISPYDKFFYEFDKEHQKSDSQKAEINKYKRIARLRDHDEPNSLKDEIWEDF